MAGEKREKKRMKWQKRNKDSGRRTERETGRCLCFCFELGGRKTVDWRIWTKQTSRGGRTVNRRRGTPKQTRNFISSQLLIRPPHVARSWSYQCAVAYLCCSSDRWVCKRHVGRFYAWGKIWQKSVYIEMGENDTHTNVADACTHTFAGTFLAK